MSGFWFLQLSQNHSQIQPAIGVGAVRVENGNGVYSCGGRNHHGMYIIHIHQRKYKKLMT